MKQRSIYRVVTRPAGALGDCYRGHEEMTGRQPKVLLLRNVRSETVRPTVRPELVEGWTVGPKPFMLRQAQHERQMGIESLGAGSAGFPRIDPETLAIS